MGNKRRVRGTFRLYLQWPLFLSALLIVLTAIVGAVSLKAGIIVSIFTLVYIGIALWLYFSRKRNWYRSFGEHERLSCGQQSN